ncbi:MAG: amidohydrolase family protein, partial [Acidimicrobiia bacterium]
LGEDRLMFASDYAIWSPKWIIEKFMAFDFPDDVKAQWGVAFGPETKAKILGLNAARLYDIPVPVTA